MHSSECMQRTGWKKPRVDRRSFSDCNGEGNRSFMCTGTSVLPWHWLYHTLSTTEAGLASAMSNLAVREQLFTAIDGSKAKWQETQAAYIDSIAAAEIGGQPAVARIRAQQPRQLLSYKDPRRSDVQAALERLTPQVEILKAHLVVHPF